MERVRKLKPGTVDAVIGDLPQRLAAADGDIARLALNEKLVDGLMTRSQFRERLLQSGAPRSDEDSETFRQISLYSYVRRVPQPIGGDAVGVIVAQGEITGGDAQQGRVGARTMVELISARGRTTASRRSCCASTLPAGWCRRPKSFASSST